MLPNPPKPLRTDSVVTTDAQRPVVPQQPVIPQKPVILQRPVITQRPPERPVGTHQPEPGLSKRAQKRARKRAKELLQQQTNDASPASSVSTTRHTPQVAPRSQVGPTHATQSEMRSVSPQDTESTVSRNQAPSLPSDSCSTSSLGTSTAIRIASQPSDPALDLKAGFRSQNVRLQSPRCNLNLMLIIVLYRELFIPLWIRWRRVNVSM
jgi:hypothetical protein